MDGEQQTAAPAALDTPASAAAVEPAEVPRELQSANEPDEPETEETPEGEPDEDDDLEFGFKKYRVPKSLKTGVEALRTDYTQKTQGAAARQQELDQREARIVQQSKATDAELQARATVLNVDRQLEQYKNVDWLRAMDEDPINAQKHRIVYEQLLDAKSTAQKTVAEGEQQRTRESQQATAKRFEEAKVYAQTKIPGWSVDTDTKLMNFVKEEGVPAEFIRDNMSPQFIKLMHMAWLGKQALSKQTAAPKPAPAEPLVPLQTVTAKAAPAARKSLSDLAKSGDMAAYAAARKADRTR